MKRYSPHTARKERQQARKLLKKDKRAKEVLVVLHNYCPKSFAMDDWDGTRIVHWSSCYTDCGTEWDYKPAAQELEALEDMEHMCECIDPATGDLLPPYMRPPAPPSALQKAPSGWRWRGARLVQVDKHGAMVRVDKKGVNRGL